MTTKQKRRIDIEMISNGLVVGYYNVGEYVEQKKYFNTRDQAIHWLLKELQDELITMHPEAEIPRADEMPF